jgi:hypothetical protein
VAVELGYYDTPREATHADIAEALGCAPNTAAITFRKARQNASGSDWLRSRPTSPDDARSSVEPRGAHSLNTESSVPPIS